jgi:peptide/nickel transport system substrate-binding protein
MPRSPRAIKGGASRRFVTAALVSLTALTLLPGCTASQNSDATDAGGTLRLAAVGAGQSESLDPTLLQGEASNARAYQIFEPLVAMGTGSEVVKYVLAKELKPNADGSVWTLKLRSGVKWHDGTPLTVEDVMYTMRYNVENATFAGPIYRSVNLANLKRIDEVTLEIPLTAPNFLFPEVLVDVNDLIIKDGTTSFAEPVGTGPFKFESFTPGQQSKFVRNEDYWGGKPALEAIEILSIDDNSARVNALLSGQVDAISDVPYSSMPQLEGAGIPVRNEPSGQWVGIRMNTRVAPFDDARVREAMRLLVDREVIVSNAYGGNATIGNDLFGWLDPAFARLPQRSYDPDKARALLEEAGHANLEIVLPTTNLKAGTNEMATLFAASAAAAGVKITVQQQSTAEFWSVPWNERPWTPTIWGARPISAQISHQMIDMATSETAWNNEDFSGAYAAATHSGDATEQRQFLQKAQAIAYEEGAYIIPAFSNLTSATAKSVSGTQSGARLAFGDYDFRHVTVE